MDDISYFWILAYAYEKDHKNEIEELKKDYFGKETFDEFGMLSNSSWHQLVEKSDQLLENYVNQFPKEKNMELYEKFGQLFQMGMSCCGTPLTIPFPYWSKLTWDLLEQVSSSEKIAIIKWLPCMKCRESSLKYIQNGVLDLESLKKEHKK